MAPPKSASITVSHSEMEGSPTEDWTEEGFRAVRMLKCAWSDRFKLAEQLRGGLRGATASTLYLPHKYPHYEAALVRSIAVRPFHDKDVSEGSDSRTASYSEAVLTVVYETPQIDTDTFTSEDVEIAKEFITLPGEQLYWQGGNAGSQGAAIGEGASPGLIVSLVAWNFTHYWLDAVPIVAKSLAGKVNQAKVTSPTLGLSFEPETLLYDGLQTTKTRSADGEEKLQVALRFLHREQTWNKALNPNTGAWSNYYRSGESEPYKPYVPDSFTKLIDITRS